MAEDWTIEKDCARCTWPSPIAKSVEIELDADCLTVEASIGRSYTRESTSAPIPVRVIVTLLQNAGWTVTAPPLRSTE